MVDTVLKQSRTPPRSPIRARCQKCLLRRSRSQRIACVMCEPQVTSKSARRVCVLRYLVSSCAIGYTNRFFAVAAVLKSRFLLSHPLVKSHPTGATCKRLCGRPRHEPRYEGGRSGRRVPRPSIAEMVARLFAYTSSNAHFTSILKVYAKLCCYAVVLRL